MPDRPSADDLADIDMPLVRMLLAAQFPEWAMLPIKAGVAACWLGICLLTFRWFVYRDRRNGSLEYAT
jgi:hypothetical protein